MTLFFSLLPLYLFGNLHCLGMCGPLVILLGRHRFRHFYFLGRTLSFSLAGFAAGEMGAVLHLILKQYFLAEIVSLLCGFLMIGYGVIKLFSLQNKPLVSSPLSPFHRWVSQLMLKDNGWSTFLFGFFTVALPCGQTLIVFSACALAANGVVGLFNGFAFALLTSPSLIVAMNLSTFLKKFKQYDQLVLGGCALIVGALACCRGFAELGMIPHLILNPNASTHYHLVIY